MRPTAEMVAAEEVRQPLIAMERRVNTKSYGSWMVEERRGMKTNEEKDQTWEGMVVPDLKCNGIM